MLHLNRFACLTIYMKLLYRITFLVLLIIISVPDFLFSQKGNSIEQLKQRLKQFENHANYFNDTAYVNTLTDLAYIYAFSYPDSALLLLRNNAAHCKASGYKKGEVDTYIITGDAFQTKGVYDKAMENYEKALQLAKHINYQKAVAVILNRVGMIHLNQANYPEALSKFYEALKAGEALGDDVLTGATLNNIGVVLFYQGRYNEADSVYIQRLKIAEKIADTSSMSVAYNGIGEVNLQQKKSLKALYNLTIANNLALKINDRENILATTTSLAETYYAMDSLQKSDSLFEYALRLSKESDYGTSICNALIGLAKTQLKQHFLKEALANGLEALQKAETIGQVQLMRDASETISSVYEALNDGNNALKYYRIYKTYSDSMNNIASQRAIAIEKASYEFSKKESEFQRKTLKQQWIITSACIGLLLLAMILWVIIRSRNHLGNTYKELQQKNQVIESQRIKAEGTLLELKSTQAQLIQSEKMASLGELTAGIAHEIQNPLNFVNNFSEVSTELIQEIQEERNKEQGARDEILQDELLNDVKQNLEKITHHGKRADGIVKGMLQHSRQTKSMKELTDINALCDEYLRLSYHGLRAKDKNFNADFKMDFDESISKINIVPQDIGRVLLNLFNNAFYAVNRSPQSLKGSEEAYKPTVSISTRLIKSPLGGQVVEIKVSDNGGGISSTIIDKIFQPFYTTKPTGEGTGLGLSLAYDIITKEHNGTIKVESKEGEGSMFIIQLPVI